MLTCPIPLLELTERVTSSSALNVIADVSSLSRAHGSRRRKGMQWNLTRRQGVDGQGSRTCSPIQQSRLPTPRATQAPYLKIAPEVLPSIPPSALCSCERNLSTVLDEGVGKKQEEKRLCKESREDRRTRRKSTLGQLSLPMLNQEFLRRQFAPHTSVLAAFRPCWSGEPRGKRVSAVNCRLIAPSTTNWVAGLQQPTFSGPSFSFHLLAAASCCFK